MSNQITGTTTRNYDPSEMLGLKHQTNDMGPYFQNAILSAPGLQISGGAGSAYSVGSGSGYAIVAGTALTFTSTGITFTTGNTGETTLTGTATYTTGADTGTTAPYATAVTDAAALTVTLLALTPTVDLTPYASAIEAYNGGQGAGVFTPGVYSTASAIGMTAAKTITLSGAGDYVFISTGGAITFGAGDNIILANGATEGRVFWVALTDLSTTGANSNLVGTFLVRDATVASTATLFGRILATRAVTVAGTANIMGLPRTGAGSALVASVNTFGVRTQDTIGVSVTARNMPALTTALRADGVSLAGDLAFNDGTVDPKTLCCRMYTFLASVNTTTGAVTLSVVAGPDFIKGRPVNVTTDVNLGDGKKAIVGYMYVKNESSAVFTPGTTLLSASGITTSLGDALGYMSYNALA